ncbi:MAG: hypothetical protein ABSB11_05035 [Sedimentisphaerales bacterium]|jgi:hypothetical protein
MFLDGLQGLFRKPRQLPPEAILAPQKGWSEEDAKMMVNLGLTVKQIQEAAQDAEKISFERTVLYREIDKACTEPLVSSAAELYADYSCPYNALQNASVWVTSKDKKYISNLTKFLNDIGIEERIYDWGYTTGCYGDMFVEVEGEPGIGIISIEDGEHPVNTARVDYRGVLVGFYKNQFDTGAMDVTPGATELLSPWSRVHFRTLGAKKRRAA